MNSLGCKHCKNQITPSYCSMSRNMEKGLECKLFKPKLPKPEKKPEPEKKEEPIERMEIVDYKPCRRCEYRINHPHYKAPCPKQSINGHSCFNSKKIRV